MKYPLLFLLFLALFQARIKAQEVPLGGWQTHFSYKSAQRLVQVQDRFYVASYNGFFSYRPTVDSTVTYSKVNGLHDTGVSSLDYDPGSRLLMLSYRNGNIDLLQLAEDGAPQQIDEWPLLRDAPNLPIDRSSHQLVFQGGLAYLSTQFGVVVLDPVRREVRETYRNIGPNGIEVAVYGLVFSADSIYAVTSRGMLRSAADENTNRQFYGNWQAVATPFKTRTVAFFAGNLYAGFPGQGIFRLSNGAWRVVYPSGSTYFRFEVINNRLTAALDGRVVMLSVQDQATVFRDPSLVAPQDAILDAANQLWVADGRQGLVSNFKGAYQSYSPTTGDTTITDRADSIVVDRNGLQWIRLPGSLGGGILVKDPSSQQQQRYLSASPNNGGLPSSRINSLSLDHDGRVWFAAEGGVGYFSPEGIFAGGTVNAVFPLIEQRRLLRDAFNTAILTEPGNRKWIGTRNGLYLFSADGTHLIRQFDTKNSPLPSDEIRALQFDAESGRLFVETPNGMVSYRSDATVPSANLQNVTIFPNPVRPDYAGVIGIKGLVEQTVVKITDLAGRLVYEIRSEGGTATWNLLDYTGRRASGGIYLVVLISPDGTESLAGKLAVIE